MFLLCFTFFVKCFYIFLFLIISFNPEYKNFYYLYKLLYQIMVYYYYFFTALCLKFFAHEKFLLYVVKPTIVIYVISSHPYPF